MAFCKAACILWCFDEHFCLLKLRHLLCFDLIILPSIVRQQRCSNYGHEEMRSDSPQYAILRLKTIKIRLEPLHRPNPPPSGSLCFWPFWGGGPGVGLALCCFVFCSAGRFIMGLALCYFVFVFFGLFCVAVASLGDGGRVSGLGAFRAFVWFCLFPFPLRTWGGCGLWLWHSLDFSLTFFT